MLREREQEPRCWSIQSQAERRDRGQTEKSWLLFEEIDTFLYGLTRKSKTPSRNFTNHKFGKVAQLVMLALQGGVPTPLVKEVQQK